MTQEITTAMVLGAGLGTRMRPLTNDKPKPMVPLAGRPLIDHVLARLEKGGIEKAVVNVHYRADVLIAHLAGCTTPRVEISDESDALLDTGGGILNALPLLGDAPFLIHNSDSVWIETATANIDNLIATWKPDAMDALLLLADASTSLGYAGKGDFVMDAEGRLARRPADIKSEHVFCGVSIMKPEHFHAASGQGAAFSLNTIWDELIARGRLYGLRHEGVWMHVGDPDALQDAETCIATHELNASQSATEMPAGLQG